MIVEHYDVIQALDNLQSSVCSPPAQASITCTVGLEERNRSVCIGICWHLVECSSPSHPTSSRILKLFCWVKEVDPKVISQRLTGLPSLGVHQERGRC